MSTALIGATGFVGGNLRRQQSFDAFFHSRNIDDLSGKRFQRVVCAGAPAAKWIANREPEADKEGLLRLQRALDTAQIDELILISTIDVYPELNGADEDRFIDVSEHHAYGKHRFELEEFVRSRFQRHLVVRLPGLFGSGLKKNAIYDFLNDNETHKIHSEAAYQFYGLDRLSDDIARAYEAGISLVNLFTEPVTISEVCSKAFGLSFSNDPGYPAPRYDAWTKHANLFGGQGHYIQSKDEVLNEISSFVASERSRGEDR